MSIRLTITQRNVLATAAQSRNGCITLVGCKGSWETRRKDAAIKLVEMGALHHVSTEREHVIHPGRRTRRYVVSTWQLTPLGRTLAMS